MRILAIETSCDETALAILEAEGGLRAPRFKIIENLVSSQIAIHRPFGGVVPNIAKREHLKNLPILFDQLLKAHSSSALSSLPKGSQLKADLLAVTVGPGLEPALWTGVEFAKEIYKKLKVKNKKLELVGVNHLEGHLYSFLLTTNYQLQTTNLFPAIALIVSGGHTILLKMDSLVKMKKLGETRDDAAGEAFDKVARLLELPYPGGPEIEKTAREGNPLAIPFPRPMLHAKNYDFSFSGLKTSVLYYLRNHTNLPQRKMSRSPSGHGARRASEGEGQAASATRGRETALFREVSLGDIAASFQQAAIDVLVAKTERAAREFKAKSIMLSGGVAANSALRLALLTTSNKLQIKFFAPPMSLNTDNAVIIGAAAYIAHLQKEELPLEANGNLNL
ncbi:MAG: tRNA (adenosine(37)-N6)-threonylcarbamoyltransferase complex transferase subunit TsaD [Candidatus Jorgensenbacteria bacterium]